MTLSFVPFSSGIVSTAFSFVFAWKNLSLFSRIQERGFIASSSELIQHIFVWTSQFLHNIGIRNCEDYVIEKKN
jgi:hypothetical protein